MIYDSNEATWEASNGYHPTTNVNMKPPTAGNCTATLIIITPSTAMAMAISS
jgi:hypothetical protein